MAATKDNIIDTISKMTVMEVVDLISEMEEKFGVTAAAAVAAAPAAAGGGEAAAYISMPCISMHQHGAWSSME